MKIADKDARQFIESVYDFFGSGSFLDHEGAEKIASWLYDHCNVSVTAQFVERVWNKLTEEEG